MKIIRTYLFGLILFCGLLLQITVSANNVNIRVDKEPMIVSKITDHTIVFDAYDKNFKYDDTNNQNIIVEANDAQLKQLSKSSRLGLYQQVFIVTTNNDGKISSLKLDTSKSKHIYNKTNVLFNILTVFIILDIVSSISICILSFFPKKQKLQTIFYLLMNTFVVSAFLTIMQFLTIVSKIHP